MKPWPDVGHDFLLLLRGIRELSRVRYTRRVLIESVSRSVLHPIKVKMDFIGYDRKV